MSTFAIGLVIAGCLVGHAWGAQPTRADIDLCNQVAMFRGTPGSSSGSSVSPGAGAGRSMSSGAQGFWQLGSMADTTTILETDRDRRRKHQKTSNARRWISVSREVVQRGAAS